MNMGVIVLREDCRFVEGAKRAAIYDLSNGKVFSINERGKEIVRSLIGKEVEEVPPDSTEFIAKLRESNLIDVVSEWDSHLLSSNTAPTINPPATRLNFIWAELTARCNLRCIHCYAGFGSITNLQDTKELSTADWKRVLCDAYGTGCREIQFIGGEPTVCRQRLLDLLQYVSGIGFNRIDVFTNATLIDRTMAETFRKHKANVRVSLYGHNPEVQGRVTGVAHSFARTERGLRLLMEYGIKPSIAVILMKENQDFIAEIKEYIESLGLEYHGYDTIRQTRKGPQADHIPNKKEIIRKRMLTQPSFRTSKSDFALNQNWNNCWYGKVAITSMGDVIPCVFERNIVFGNVQTESISSILDKPELVSHWSITKDQIEICKDCEYRYACHDCRPLSLGECGDLYAKYPRCFYDPYSGTWSQ